MSQGSKFRPSMLPNDPEAAAKLVLSTLQKEAAQAEIVAMARKHLTLALEASGSDAAWHKKKASELMKMVRLT